MTINKKVFLFSAFFLGSFGLFAQQSTTVSNSEIVRHVRFLASKELKGRLSGTPECDLAARYLASEFLRLGLEPFGEKVEEKLVGRSFEQDFEVTSKPVIGKDSRLEWTTNSKNHRAPSEEFQILAFSSSGEAEGEKVEIAYELFLKKEFPAQSKGKIFLVRELNDASNPHSLGGFKLAKLAKEAGAKALLIVKAPTKAAEPAASGAGATAHSVHSETTADSGILVASISESLISRLGNRVKIVAALERPKKPTHNVLAVLPGKDPKAQYIVIGAHYDHLGSGGEYSLSPGSNDIHYGADDNASGTAALLEIASQLASEKGKLERNILFAAFSGEEMGLLGSAHFVKEAPIPLTQIAAMLNLDMVGRLREGKLEVGGVGTSPIWKDLLDRANAGPTLNIKPSQTALGFGGSDHLSFYHKDIPVLFFFTGLHADYHKPSDTAEKINFDGIERISELVGAVARELAASKESIVFTKPNEPERKEVGNSPRAYLGSIPEYGDYNDGVHISGTTPGSPADKAGLKGGDVITRLGTIAIANIYDLTHALESYKAGETIEVEFVRQGEKKVISLTLGSR